jgi:hypothetical protein
MLKSAVAVKALAALCFELHHYNVCLDRRPGDTAAIKGIKLYNPLVTAAAAKAKTEIAKLSPDQFLQHCLEVSEIDTAPISWVTIQSEKPKTDFTASMKLFTQLKMFEACHNYAMRETGFEVETAVLARTTVALATNIVDIETTAAAGKDAAETKFRYTPKKLSAAVENSDLKRAAQKAQAAIDAENRARLLGIAARETRKAAEKNSRAADIFLAAAIAKASK